MLWCVRRLWVGLLVGLLLCAGCETLAHCRAPANIPHELSTASLPPYVIEPPDVLLIDAVRLIPKPPYHVGPLDVLGILVTGTLPEQPIAGTYTVMPEGTIALGYMYGTIQAEGLTLPEVKAVIEKQLKGRLAKYEVTVELVESRAIQQIRGPHLVRPDGTVGLGVYGSVYVDNLTIPEAKAALENFLAQFFLKPEISLDVAGFNSKVYYIITDAAVGDIVYRFPVQGKTTVLDAISQVNGLSQVSSKCGVSLVRPTLAVEETKHGAGHGCPADCADGDKGKLAEEVYPVDWQGIVAHGDARTNYQVLPGDRIYVRAEPLIVTDTYLALFLNPMQRILGTVGLGNDTVRQFLTPIPTNGVSIVP